MPLLYRILMRLAAVVAVLGGALALLLIANGAADPVPGWVVLVIALLPAGALYILAWIVRPPLDRASLRRLWRE